MVLREQHLIVSNLWVKRLLRITRKTWAQHVMRAHRFLCKQGLHRKNKESVNAL